MIKDSFENEPWVTSVKYFLRLKSDYNQLCYKPFKVEMYLQKLNVTFDYDGFTRWFHFVSKANSVKRVRRLIIRILSQSLPSSKIL